MDDLADGIHGLLVHVQLELGEIALAPACILVVKGRVAFPKRDS